MQTAGVKANLPKAELVAALQKSAEEWISDDEDEKSAPLHEKNTPLDENSVDDKNASYDVQNPIIVDDQVGLYFRQIRLFNIRLLTWPDTRPIILPDIRLSPYIWTPKMLKFNALSSCKS